MALGGSAIEQEAQSNIVDNIVFISHCQWIVNFVAG